VVPAKACQIITQGLRFDAVKAWHKVVFYEERNSSVRQ